MYQLMEARLYPIAGEDHYRVIPPEVHGQNYIRFDPQLHSKIIPAELHHRNFCRFIAPNNYIINRFCEEKEIQCKRDKEDKAISDLLKSELDEYNAMASNFSNSAETDWNTDWTSSSNNLKCKKEEIEKIEIKAINTDDNIVSAVSTNISNSEETNWETDWTLFADTEASLDVDVLKKIKEAFVRKIRELRAIRNTYLDNIKSLEVHYKDRYEDYEVMNDAIETLKMDLYCKQEELQNKTLISTSAPQTTPKTIKCDSKTDDNTIHFHYSMNRTSQPFVYINNVHYVPSEKADNVIKWTDHSREKSTDTSDLIGQVFVNTSLDKSDSDSDSDKTLVEESIANENKIRASLTVTQCLHSDRKKSKVDVIPRTGAKYLAETPKPVHPSLIQSGAKVDKRDSQIPDQKETRFDPLPQKIHKSELKRQIVNTDVIPTRGVIAQTSDVIKKDSQNPVKNETRFQFIPRNILLRDSQQTIINTDVKPTHAVIAQTSEVKTTPAVITKTPANTKGNANDTKTKSSNRMIFFPKKK